MLVGRKHVLRRLVPVLPTRATQQGPEGRGLCQLVRSMMLVQRGSFQTENLLGDEVARVGGRCLPTGDLVRILFSNVFFGGVGGWGWGGGNDFSEVL